MDLFAYMNIKNLEDVARANGIEVPRLRGYRLMSEERAITPEEIQKSIRDMDAHICELAVESYPTFSMHPLYYEFSDRTERLKQKYLIRKKKVTECEDGRSFTTHETVGFRWDRLHGKRRKNLKYVLKVTRKDVIHNLTTFNKYAGRNDVLYIHAKIGGGNWPEYRSQVENQPWFIEKVDDYFDHVYCDIYARISPIDPKDIRESEETDDE